MNMPSVNYEPIVLCTAATASQYLGCVHSVLIAGRIKLANWMKNSVSRISTALMASILCALILIFIFPVSLLVISIEFYTCRVIQQHISFLIKDLIQMMYLQIKMIKLNSISMKLSNFCDNKCCGFIMDLWNNEH